MCAGREGLSRAQVYTGLIHTTRTSRLPVYLGGGINGGSGRADGWYWLDLLSVSRLHDDDFSRWADGQPWAHRNHSSVAFEKACMYLDGSQDLKWVPTHCDKPRQFICHFNAVPRARRKKSRKTSAKRQKQKKRGRGRRHKKR